MARVRSIDVAELAVGASVLAMPLAVTEEVWNLSAELPAINVLLIALVSCGILASFIYLLQDGADRSGTHVQHLVRIAVTYGVTLLVCTAILALVDRLPLFEDPLLAVKRVILVAFPASFAATVVDNLK